MPKRASRCSYPPGLVSVLGTYDFGEIISIDCCFVIIVFVW